MGAKGSLGSFAKSLKIAQLVVGGAIIGFYAAKGLGFLVGFDIGYTPENFGAVTGAILVVIGKLLHFV